MTTNTLIGATAGTDIARDAHIRVRDVGVGEPVLLIMGAAGSIGLWSPLEPFLTEGHRAISYDNRGLGGSSRGGAAITTAGLADDAAALLAALRIDRAYILGWSLGSAVAQELALRHPDRVASLVLYGAWCRLDGFQRTLLTAMRHPWDTGDLEVALAALGLCFSPQLLNAPDFADMLAPFLPMFPQTPEQARVVAEQWDAVFAHDTENRLSEVAAPALVVSGEQDLVTPRGQCEAVAQALPDAELVTIDGPGSGHALHVERTAEFARAVTEFWARHPISG